MRLNNASVPSCSSEAVVSAEARSTTARTLLHSPQTHDLLGYGRTQLRRRVATVAARHGEQLLAGRHLRSVRTAHCSPELFDQGLQVTHVIDSLAQTLPCNGIDHPIHCWVGEIVIAIFEVVEVVPDRTKSVLVRIDQRAVVTALPQPDAVIEAID